MKSCKIFRSAMLLILVLNAIVITSAYAASTRTTLHGSTPAWAKFNNYTGLADPNGSVGFRVYLGWQNDDAAEAFARSVSDLNSSYYYVYASAKKFIYLAERLSYSFLEGRIS